MTHTKTANTKSQLDKFKEAARELECDDDLKRFKERVGKLTVQMTMIMVLTLLPALLIVTAGPGFMGVMRSLQHTGGH